MDARRVDADSSGARDGVARLSVRPFRGVELRFSKERVSATLAAKRRRAGTSADAAIRRGVKDCRVVPMHGYSVIGHRFGLQRFEFPGCIQRQGQPRLPGLLELGRNSI